MFFVENGSERYSEGFSLLQNGSERNSEHFYLTRNGSERTYEVPSVFIFYKMVWNGIPSFFILRGMAVKGIPNVSVPRRGRHNGPRMFVFTRIFFDIIFQNALT
jgi:hypothetical protein